jgi:DNA-binding NarL/FixJ family response regulator
MKDKIRIHLADHQVLIDGMSTLLNTVSDFEVIGYSLDGSSLYDDVNSKANILILDISMPKKDGIAVIKEFAKRISL